MRLEARKYLFDIREACRRIEEYTDRCTFEEYRQDSMLRSAVERQFEIAGEAMNRLLKVEPDLSASISDTRKIISFRNVLIHAYSTVSETMVWSAVQNNLAVLAAEVGSLLDEEDADTDGSED